MDVFDGKRSGNGDIDVILDEKMDGNNIQIFASSLTTNTNIVSASEAVQATAMADTWTNRLHDAHGNETGNMESEFLRKDEYNEVINGEDTGKLEVNNIEEKDKEGKRGSRGGHNPLWKMTKGLINTYVHINEVYYAEKEMRKKQNENEIIVSKSTSITTGTVAAAVPEASTVGDAVQQDTKISRTVQQSSERCDDENGDYQYKVGDVLLDRYTILKGIGNGSFGRVVEAMDNIEGEKVAIKIIKSKKPFFKQAQSEIKLLDELRRKDVDNKMGVVKMKRTFVWENHQCIVFEHLSHNLYDLLHNTNFQGVSLTLIKKFGKQLLRTLSYLSRPDIDIVHCDLKPENILLQTPYKAGIKVIDFGSSCKTGEQVYTYIQSRFYRSPEVILGMRYSVAIDMWSLGCILMEMHCGDPFFSGYDEHDQIRLFVSALGMPPSSYLDRGSKTSRYFDRVIPQHYSQNSHLNQQQLFSPQHQQQQQRWTLKPNYRSDGKQLKEARTIREALGIDPSDIRNPPFKRRESTPGHSQREYESFADLISKMLVFESDLRIKPHEALSHPFFSPGVSSSSSSPSPSLPSSSPKSQPEKTVEREIVTSRTKRNTNSSGNNNNSSNKSNNKDDAQRYDIREREPTQIYKRNNVTSLSSHNGNNQNINIGTNKPNQNSGMFPLTYLSSSITLSSGSPSSISIDDEEPEEKDQKRFANHHSEEQIDSTINEAIRRLSLNNRSSNSSSYSSTNSNNSITSSSSSNINSNNGSNNISNATMTSPEQSQSINAKM